MTRGCTLHRFLTRETPCTPLPVPADYPDPCRGYRFLEGTGIGHREVTRGLPVPITSSGLLEIGMNIFFSALLIQNVISGKKILLMTCLYLIER